MRFRARPVTVKSLAGWFADCRLLCWADESDLVGCRFSVLVFSRDGIAISIAIDAVGSCTRYLCTISGTGAASLLCNADHESVLLNVLGILERY